ncbi:SH3 domain-containing protein [Myxococcus sp. K38C18041901]|uniref:SH3 domain-containing protein n=1 Tax=Myxococcus guangdongensis TaxID=2906760 RepID=UPI0020A71A38|nr:SH3 domain-containing protein [Myxococcus guangdongensis]MCP3064930.1 SH3 domain-containing protein [Myxococcus guangdongensis]
MSSALLLSLLLSQTEVPTLSYTATQQEESKPRELEQFEFTTFAPSKKADLFVGVDEANLRKSPSSDAAVVTTLPLGAAVRVLARGEERLKVGEYVNHWYSVEYRDAKGGDAVQGWLFGNTLTPFRFEEDFDGDGEKEIATVVMSNDFKIRVRILEPGVKPPRRVSSADARTAGGAYLSVDGGPAQVRLIPSKTAGLVLLQVDSRPEACGDYLMSYVSYTVPGNKKGVLGKAKLAFEAAGLSDPPVHSSIEVSFQPRKKELTLTRTNSDEGEDGAEQSTKEVTRYRLEDGVYAEQKPVGAAAASE